ncbi:MAG: polysaccharide biosynthesis/export family protein [Bacteroidetes bacterium]|nr:polysaccharide biosynthesis/export family protein [Bacteroidota bacterium]
MKKIVPFLLVAIVFTGCRIMNPSLMLKTPKGYQYSQMKDTVANLEYRISPNDVIELRVFSNDGFKLTDVTSTNTPGFINVNQGTLPYTVDVEGNAKLPVLGNISLKGLTIREAQLMLEEKYSLYYIRPFILLKVTSRRVIIFPGTGGTSKVIILDHNNITLLEGLAMAGGLSYDGKAYQIKLIRRTPGKPSEVYHIDLSTIDGLKQGNIVLQSNDIIYVQQRIRISQGIVTELSPIISIISSFLLVYTVINLRK